MCKLSKLVSEQFSFVLSDRICSFFVMAILLVSGKFLWCCEAGAVKQTLVCNGNNNLVNVGGSVQW